MQIIQGIFYAFIMLVIEGAMVYRWLKKKYLYEKNMTFGQIMTRSQKLYRFLYYFYIRENVSLSSELQKFLALHKKIYRKMGIVFLRRIIGIIVFSLVSVIFTIAGGNLSVQIVFFVFSVFMVKSLGKEREVATTNALDQYIIFLASLDMKFRQEIQTAMFHVGKEKGRMGIRKEIKNLYHEIKPELKGDFSKIVAFVSYLLCFITLKKLLNGEMDSLKAVCWTCGIVLIIALGAIFYHCVAILKALGYKLPQFISEKRKDKITICPELRDWGKDIKRMCVILKVRTMSFEVHDNEQDIAYYRFTISISRFHMENMRSYFPPEVFENVILFIVGHELVHAYDSQGNTEMKVIYLFVIAMFICSYVSLRLIAALGMLSLLTFIIWFLVTLAVFGPIILPMRKTEYWNQVQELRADRISMKISGLNASVFLNSPSIVQKNGWS